MKNRCKVFAAALAALLLGAACAPAALAEGDLIEVNEDIAVSADYDWTRFADDGITLNVYTWGL